MGGFEYFQKKIRKSVLPIARRLLKQNDSKSKNESLSSSASDSQGRKVSVEFLFVQRVVVGHSEILESFESLKNIEIYLRSFPYRKQKVAPTAYLRYNVENYLQEMYILHERLQAYLKVIQRAYRKEPDALVITQKITSLKSKVDVAFQNVLRARGAHVHESRFEDARIKLLLLLDLLSQEDDDFKPRYEAMYLDVRDDKVRWVKATNESIKKTLDVYFDELGRILFTRSGKFRFPFKAAG